MNGTTIGVEFKMTDVSIANGNPTVPFRLTCRQPLLIDLVAQTITLHLLYEDYSNFYHTTKALAVVKQKHPHTRQFFNNIPSWGHIQSLLIDKCLNSFVREAERCAGPCGRYLARRVVESSAHVCAI